MCQGDGGSYVRGTEEVCQGDGGSDIRSGQLILNSISYG